MTSSSGIRTAIRAAIIAVLVASAAGCPTGPNSGREAGVTLHVVNNSSDDVAYLYVAPTGSERWGQDLLGDANVIPPGSSWPVRVAPGTYDLKVEDFDHNVIDTVTGVRLTEDSEWVLSGE